MTAQSKDPSVQVDPNLTKLAREGHVELAKAIETAESVSDELNKVAETAKSVSDDLLRHTKKKALEADIQRVATEVTMLERNDATEARRRLVGKQRELEELRAQIKREFPETDRRWWHALLFWRKS